MVRNIFSGDNPLTIAEMVRQTEQMIRLWPAEAQRQLMEKLNLVPGRLYAEAQRHRRMLIRQLAELYAVIGPICNRDWKRTTKPAAETLAKLRQINEYRAKRVKWTVIARKLGITVDQAKQIQRNANRRGYRTQ